MGLVTRGRPALLAQLPCVHLASTEDVLCIVTHCDIWALPAKPPCIWGQCRALWPRGAIVTDQNATKSPILKKCEITQSFQKLGPNFDTGLPWPPLWPNPISVFFFPDCICNLDAASKGEGLHVCIFSSQRQGTHRVQWELDFHSTEDFTSSFRVCVCVCVCAKEEITKIKHTHKKEEIKS